VGPLVETDIARLAARASTSRLAIERVAQDVTVAVQGISQLNSSSTMSLAGLNKSLTATSLI